MILCDTNILVAYYRGDTVIRDVLARHEMQNLCVSIVTIGELYHGARDKTDLARIRRHLMNFDTLPIDSATSMQFVRLMEQFSLSHRPTVPDTLIAAAALTHGAELFTLNVRDFRFIPELRLFQP